MKIMQMLFNQKFRFEMGQQFMGFINFTLLLIATSDELKAWLGIEKTWKFVALAVVGGYFCVWALGLFLDKVVRYGQYVSDAQLKRSPYALENGERLIRIEKKLNEVLRGNNR